MKDGQLFRVKVIKDESDLPKEQDRYFCHDRSYSNDFIMTLWFELTQHSKFDWLQNVDWYLILEPEIAEKSDVSDADIEAWAEMEFGDAMIIPETAAFMGAKAMRDGLIGKGK